jgi:hypothetical protein
MDSIERPFLRLLQLRCEWCGATSAAGGNGICSSLSDEELLQHYYGATDAVCNRQTWKHRRALFEPAVVEGHRKLA